MNKKSNCKSREDGGTAAFSLASRTVGGKAKSCSQEKQSLLAATAMARG